MFLKQLQVMRFSPDGKYLAVGSRNNMIYIYQVMDNYRKYDRIGRCVVCPLSFSLIMRLS